MYMILEKCIRTILKFIKLPQEIYVCKIKLNIYYF